MDKLNDKGKNQYNEHGYVHGYWEQYFDNGSLLFKGNFNYGKFFGYGEWYGYGGELEDKVFYL